MGPAVLTLSTLLSFGGSWVCSWWTGCGCSCCCCQWDPLVRFRGRSIRDIQAVFCRRILPPRTTTIGLVALARGGRGRFGCSGDGKTNETRLWVLLLKEEKDGVLSLVWSWSSSVSSERSSSCCSKESSSDDEHDTSISSGSAAMIVLVLAVLLLLLVSSSSSSGLSFTCIVRQHAGGRSSSCSHPNASGRVVDIGSKIIIITYDASSEMIVADRVGGRTCSAPSTVAAARLARLCSSVVIFFGPRLISRRAPGQQSKRGCVGQWSQTAVA